MTRHTSALALSVALAAGGCVSPEALCRDDATRALRNIDLLIAESEAALRRGYRIETREVSTSVLETCASGYRQGEDCLVEGNFIERRPVAMSQEAEAQRLMSLRASRVEIVERTEVALARCAVSAPPR